MVDKMAQALAAPSGFALTRSANPIASRRAHSVTTPARFAHLNLRHVAFPRFYSWRKRPPDLLSRRQLKTHSGKIAGCSGWRALSLGVTVVEPICQPSGFFLFVELRGAPRIEPATRQPAAWGYLAAEPFPNRAPPPPIAAQTRFFPPRNVLSLYRFKVE